MKRAISNLTKYAFDLAALLTYMVFEKVLEVASDIQSFRKRFCFQKVIKFFSKILLTLTDDSKGVFFSEIAMCSSNLQKKIFQKTILDLKFKFPSNNSKVLLARNSNFKFRIVFWNIFLAI